MKNLIQIKKKITSDWFKSLQNKIIVQFQLLENEASKKKKTKKFIISLNLDKMTFFFLVEKVLGCQMKSIKK